MALIEEWRGKSPGAQRSFLEKTIESLELGQLYYENKENGEGVARLGECIDLIRERLLDLGGEVGAESGVVL